MNLVEGKKNDNPKLKFSPLTLSDIKDTWQYISEQGEEAVERVVREIVKKCDPLFRNPKIGCERNDLVTELRFFPCKNYNTFYSITSGGVRSTA